MIKIYMDAEAPLAKVMKIPAHTLRAFARLGIRAARDLLFHFPFRYEDFSRIKPIAEIMPGETATVRARLKKIQAARAWQKRMFIAEAEVEDESGKMRAVWFNQPYLAKILRPGEMLALSGKFSKSRKGFYFANPSYERIGKTEIGVHTSGLVPVYPETIGLTSRWIRRLTHEVLPLAETLKDPLPESMRLAHGLLPLGEALRSIHFPADAEAAAAAKKRFSFEEVLLIQLRAARHRRELAKRLAPPIPICLPEIKSFVASLPFPLTDAQRRAAWEILNDTQKSAPMNRLLDGDVGSGKTLVATLAALNAARGGYQTAYLAPTEILALQHFETFAKFLAPRGVAVGLLTASEKRLEAVFGNSKKANISQLAREGSVDILIGTHAVIEDKIQFKNIGLVIVDEQHRFGVNQRAKLQKKHETAALIPHFLSMTATPIPRTLALTVYGDLDISLLNESPPGRKPIITKIAKAGERGAMYGFIRREIARGRQAFVICPRIEAAESDAAHLGHTLAELAREEVKAVKTEHEKLAKNIFPELRVGMLHGKMKPKEKEAAMRAFKDGRFDILVATSVIEVGVDIPNASVMVIDGAEKFGLAQIHQFRGRVGRSEHQSYCFLAVSEGFAESSARLAAAVTAKNGFELAEKDLLIRGPGDFFGTRQSGIPAFAHSAFADLAIVQAARAAATEIMRGDPELRRHPLLKERLEKIEAATHLE